MPAKIVVVQGDKPGAVRWIEDEVVRVGSGPLCEVRIDHHDVPPHAATLEFSGGRYTLFNRCGHALRIDGRDLAEGASSPWAVGRDLFLADDLVVRLVVDGDPAPVRRPVAAVPDDEGDAGPDPPEGDEDQEGEGVESESAANTVVQVVVTLLCVAAIPILLNYDKSHSASPGHAEKAHATFESLAREVVTGPSRDDAGLKAILSAIQDARIAEIRGKKAETRTDLVSALETVESRQAPGGGYATELEGEIDDYLRTRLKNLTAPEP